jgi:hypothetical protein
MALGPSENALERRRPGGGLVMAPRDVLPQAKSPLRFPRRSR